MRSKSVIVLALTAVFSLPHIASASSVLDVLFGGIQGRGEDSFLKAKEQALADKDPWHAWTLLSASAPDDISDDVREKYSELGSSLVLSAARENNPEAVLLVFSRDDGRGFKESRPELYKSLLNMADKSAGSPKDKELLMAAGDVLQEGKLTIKDSQRAAGFYARAWLVGEKHAPARLYRLYQGLKDPGSAYLWQIRCINDCYIWSEQNDMPVSQSLTSRQIQLIQTLARDNTVITVNGIAARKESE